MIVATAMASAQQSEIHRCIQDDGTIAFQEMPCPEKAPSDEEEPAPDAVRDEYDEFFVADTYVVPDVELPSEDRAACEKTTRDAIDAIDLEMRKGFTEEEGEAYLATLLELTQQLRECKRL